MSGIKIATAAHSHSFPGGALGFMSCTSGRESLTQEENEISQPPKLKTENKKKKFHPLRNLRRMFRRKARRSSISADSYQAALVDRREVPPVNLEQRSCSTSRLQEDNSTKNYISNSNNNNRLNSGLSLSHDSIFTPERADSGLSSSDLGNSFLSITVLTPPSKECATKSQQSSCSETSLLSIGSSEVDELSPVRNRKLSDLDVGVSSYKLNHSAAKHKMAVKPKRNHGAPRNRRKPMTSISPLPTTLEVNEEKITGQSSPFLEKKLFSCPNNNYVSTVEQESKMNDFGVKCVLKSEEDEEEEERPQQSRPDKEIESGNQRSESFFGRFLSKRSEKKKKNLEATSAKEEGSGNDSCYPLGKKFGRSGKSPDGRHKVEPVEIPSSAAELAVFNENRKEKKLISSSLSPPESVHWPTQMTSRSMSPPKGVWTDDSTSRERTDGGGGGGGDDGTRLAWTDSKSLTRSPSEKLSNDVKNHNFVKELTNSVSLFAKDDYGKRKYQNENNEKIKEKREEVEIVEKEKESGEQDSFYNTEIIIENTMVKMQHFGEMVSEKTVILVENSPLKVDSENVQQGESSKCTQVETLTIQVNPTKKILGSSPSASPCKDDTVEEFDKVKVIESTEKRESTSGEDNKSGKINLEFANVEIPPEIASEDVKIVIKSMEPTNDIVDKPEDEKIEPKTVQMKSKSVEKTATEVVKRVKPVVSQKPKDLKRLGTTGLAKINKITINNSEIKGRSMMTDDNKSLVNVVDETKSESSCETESSEWTSKEASIVEESSLREKINVSTVKTEEVALRKRINSGHSDDQPELMKVFARRSLKIRETEKGNEDMQRSRDSDKENEKVDSPKGERKKSCENEDTILYGSRISVAAAAAAAASSNGNENETANVTSLKPKMATNKNVPQKYGRSLSENNARKDETDIKPAILEENKINRAGRRITDVTGYHVMIKDERHELEEDEEKQNGGGAGFKRIQQRKAEWERRAQQSATK